MDREGGYTNKQNNKNIARSNIKPDLLFHGKNVTKMFLGKQLSWERKNTNPWTVVPVRSWPSSDLLSYQGSELCWTIKIYMVVVILQGLVTSELSWSEAKQTFCYLLFFPAILELHFCWQLLSMAICDTSALWSLLLSCCFSRLRQRCWLWPTKPLMVWTFLLDFLSLKAVTNRGVPDAVLIRELWDRFLIEDVLWIA